MSTDARPKPPLPDWQPIDTAPAIGVALVCGRWPNGNAWWNIAHCTDGVPYGDWDNELEPTHWMPLPTPPEPSA